MLKKTITSDFFTTISFSQTLDSLYLMTFGLKKIKKGEDKKLFEKELLEYIGKTDSKIISFYNARSAIYHALKMIGIKSEDEIIVNGYNCVSVSNAIIQTGAKIVYSDIEEETLSFEIKDLEKNITKKTKVIILQYTFGKKPKFYNKIINLAKEKNILIVEDLAHSLDTNLDGKGDFLIFSTGRDKVISSITGGFLVINNSKYFTKIEKVRKHLQMPKIKLILQNLSYNIFGYFAYKFYDFFGVGKVIILLSRKLKLITEILSVSEKSCNFNLFNLDFPNSLAYLARKELRKLHSYEDNRKKIIKYYLKNIKNNKIELIFKDFNNYNSFRFPILLNSKDDLEKIIKIGKKNNILLGASWSRINIAPLGTDLKKAHYKKGTCPSAENFSSRVLTLANHSLINQKDAEKIVRILNKF